MVFKYLHPVGPGCFWLDHKLTPEVRACLCAQSSRAPVGGIRVRYGQVVDAIAEANWDGPLTDRVASGNKDIHGLSWKDALALQYEDKVLQEIHERHLYDARQIAEDRLCEYPLHPRFQKFFDEFVGRYGHSSVMELTGSPTIFAEGISWLTAWLLFDSPLCTGQEFSTRAVQHADWPMARECNLPSTGTQLRMIGDGDEATGPVIPNKSEPHPDLVELHNDWFEVFEAEVAWWKEHLSSEENRKALGIGDKEPFRPALDRARWALPGTIATGCGHTSHLRDRARVLRDGSLLAQESKAASVEAVWKDIAEAYKQALPGLAGMGLREAVYGADSQIPGHLATMFSSAPDGPDAEITMAASGGLSDVQSFSRPREKTYLDPLANTLAQVNITFRCSLAVARDWHRQRTAYPWHLQVVRAQHLTAEPGPIQIDSHYQPMSDIGKAKVPELLARSTAVFDRFMADRNLMQAGLALPLGTRVRMRGQAGLRDAVYLLELRKYAHGANFEYQDQATKALDQLRDALKEAWLPDGRTVAETFGLVP